VKNKRINRRKFLVSSLQNAAGLAILTGCNKRDIVGIDVRQPSMVAGLTNEFTIDPNTNNITEVKLSWNPHDLTDISGIKTETAIQGYNIFRSSSISPTVEKLNALPFTTTRYTDASVFEIGQSYFYYVQAVDATGNASPPSQTLEVYITEPKDIYVAKNPSAVNSSGYDLVYDQVKKTVEAAVMAVAKGLTGNAPADIGAAYQAVLEYQRPEDVLPVKIVTNKSLIGIKINTLAASSSNNLWTHKEVVKAIAEGLKQMFGSTFPEKNIIVFDDRFDNVSMKQMSFANFSLQDVPTFENPYIVASANYNTMLNGVAPTQKESYEQLWSFTPITVFGVSQRLSKIVEKVDFIINVPVLKDHVEGGITFSMKNMYGVVNNPGALHGVKPNDKCNPYIPALYTYVKNKVKLIIGDALVGSHTNGPMSVPSFKPCQIIAGTDPVAIDKYALQLINNKRIEEKMVQHSDSESGTARHLLTAAKPPYKLGSINPKIVAVPV
jgi:uncharacterized protein (DUF362 family)